MNPEKFMQRAIQLAEKGRGNVEPNPLVGCVIAKNGKIIGQGFHQKFGGPHAEIRALRQAKKAARGATAYVTLEPCAHYGKTPPCTNALILAGVKEIVVGGPDPHPLVHGKGIRQLRQAGIRVLSGVLQKECEEINPAFMHFHRTHTPFVLLKAAISADGKIADETGKSKWVTSSASRKLTRKIRDSFDSIAVGAHTILKDNPRLNGKNKKTLKIIFDGKLSIPLNARALQTGKTIMLCAKNASGKKKQSFKKQGIEIIELPAKEGKISVPAALQALGKKGITSLLVEGGSQLHGEFLNAHAAHELLLIMAPKILGGRGLSWNAAGFELGKNPTIKWLTQYRIENDLFLHGKIHYREKP
ncbi:MAG: bifunctional diaminohydroxyphosphoribosylaminopyrimidine deaminase/5-amino-6-(5-phosphoribosylamino)uracil reductase RibD [Candidatus Diapherotrites archaeon]|nr:bifunctional diaminohydroxyphosphoribosylaminopyrimidine deaminase/5-amino-6-(5-phosphoribosylamino)uracil reductase RibD [Candidatus Diapherotrites archaeon]